MSSVYDSNTMDYRPADLFSFFSINYIYSSIFDFVLILQFIFVSKPPVDSKFISLFNILSL